MFRYPIPKKRLRVEHRASNSRFIATVDRASTVEDAKAFIAEIRAEMSDASHHVYAYKVGFGSSVTEGMSDDGEPSGTSGPPALAVLRGAGVGDVVLVITRYFGGTKLGTGGLVAAYGASAKAAFAALETIEKVRRCRVAIRLPYAQHDRFKQFLKSYEITVENTEYAEEITLTLLLPEEDMSVFTQGLSDFSNGQLTPEMLEEGIE